MPIINGKVCVVNGKPVDKVYSNGKQVYGRNLLQNSNFSRENNYYNWSNATGNIMTIDNMTALKIVTDNNANESNLGIFVPTNNLQMSEPYSYQITIKSEVDSIIAYLGYQGGLATNCKAITLTTKWQTFKVNGELFANGNPAFRIYVPRASTTVYVTNLKLEQGTIATPWTPAPEDVGVTQSA